MKIILTGLPYFARKLHAELSSFDSKNKYYFFDTYYSFKDRIGFLLHLPFIDKVISLNGVSDKSGSLDWVMRFRKKLILLWQGTDVLIARQRYETNSLDRKYIDYATHFTDASWLAEELSLMGIVAGQLHFKSFAGTEKYNDYSGFSAYTYIPKGKETFYGWNTIHEAFKKLPQIKLYVYGTDGSGLEHSENIVFKGWINSIDYNKEISNHSVYIRLTEHDGFSLSVLDALSKGSEVMWNYPLELCHLISFSSEMFRVKVKEIEKLCNERNLSRNQEAMLWVEKYFNREQILSTFINTITK